MWGWLKQAAARRRKGAIALIAVGAMLPVSAYMTASMNGGQMIDDRRGVQDASDALAMMHGAWAARSLNTIAMNNVTTTQLLVVAIGSEALQETMIEFGVATGLALTHIHTNMAKVCFKSTGEPISTFLFVASCVAFHEFKAIPAYEAIAYLLKTNGAYKPKHGVDSAHDALEAIEEMNTLIVARFPRAMREIGEDYAQEMGFDAFHFADPCDGDGVKNCNASNSSDGMALPLEEGATGAKIAMCQAMDNGYSTDLPLPRYFTTYYTRGFEVGEGPMLFGGSDTQPHVREFINEDTEIGKELADFKEYFSTSDSDLPVVWPLVPSFSITLEFLGIEYELEYNNPGAPAVKHPQWANLQFEQAEEGPNSFTRAFNRKYYGLCPASALLSANRNPGGNAGGGGAGGTPGLGDVNDPDFGGGSGSGLDCDNLELTGIPPIDLANEIQCAADRAMEEAAEKAAEAFQDVMNDLTGLLGDMGDVDVTDLTALLLRADVPTQWITRDISPLNPLPPRAADDMPPPFQILAFAANDITGAGKRLGRQVLQDNVKYHYGYAQVTLFNPDGADMFSQNWQYTMTPATRMDNASQAASALGSEATSVFDDLVTSLSAVNDSTTWGRVHAH